MFIRNISGVNYRYSDSDEIKKLLSPRLQSYLPSNLYEISGDFLKIYDDNVGKCFIKSAFDWKYAIKFAFNNEIIEDFKKIKDDDNWCHGNEFIISDTLGELIYLQMKFDCHFFEYWDANIFTI